MDRITLPITTFLLVITLSSPLTRWTFAEGQGSAILTVDSDPAGAQVFLDGTDTGKVTPCELKVDLGTTQQKLFEVSVKKEGYKSRKTILTLSVSKPTTWHVELIPLPRKNSIDGAVMVWVPMTKLDGKTNLGGFWMYQCEVTNEQFEAFVRSTDYTAAEKDTWRFYWKKFNEGGANHPVVAISWQDAVAYCQWAGTRLPTQQEWEWAARGGLTGKKYVWGDVWPPPAGTGNFADESALHCRRIQAPFIRNYRDGFDYTAPVGSFLPNGYGLFDMAGNVWEWTNTRIRTYNEVYKTYSNETVVICGGCFGNYEEELRISPKPVRNLTAESNLETLGFRCVKSERISE